MIDLMKDASKRNLRRNAQTTMESYLKKDASSPIIEKLKKWNESTNRNSPMKRNYRE
jgi:hypothetical protein